MTINIHRETAKVFQFPLRPRRRLDNGTTAPAEVFEVAPSVVDTSCWYHDDAVRDVEVERPKPC